MNSAYLDLKDKNTGEVFRFFGQEVVEGSTDSFVRTFTGDNGTTVTFEAPFIPDILTVIALDAEVVRANQETTPGVTMVCSNFTTKDTVGTVVQYLKTGNEPNKAATNNYSASTTVGLISTKDSSDGLVEVTYGNLPYTSLTVCLQFTSGVRYMIVGSKIAE